MSTAKHSSGLPIADGHYEVTLEEALEMHEALLGVGGGRPGVMRLEALLGALGRPYHGYHETLGKKAAALLHAIATSHAFADGYKRTAPGVTLLMIARSGCRLELREGEGIDDVPVDLIEGRMMQDGLVAWFGARLVPR